jgi:signal transduction histidine kinase/CheY-like chemotaxis protein
MEQYNNNDIQIEIETTQTLDTMLHQVLNQALVTIRAEAGSLMLVANKRGLLQIKARLGKPRANRKREQVYKISDSSMAAHVVQTKEPYLCNDVENDPYFSPSRSGKNFASLLSVPVVFQNRVIAVINADAPEKGFFTDYHKDRLMAVAKQVAGPIAERISILDALAEVGVELSRLPGEGGVERVLERIAQVAVRSLGADVVTLYQYIQEKDEFPVEGTGPTIYPEVRDSDSMRRKVFPGDVPWTIVNERKSGFYSDVINEDFLSRDIERLGENHRPRFIEREGIKSMASLLLPYRAAESRDEEVVGVMFVNYRTHHEFNIDEISALATFADYASVAILNARLEQRRRIEQMRIAESISANFAHRMSNLGGTAKPAAGMIRQILKSGIDPMIERQLTRIERESDLLLGLAERIARPFKETGKMAELVPIDIGSLLREETDWINRDLGNLTVKIYIQPDLPKVKSVDFQLRQVLHDIIYNAIEAMAGQVDGVLSINTWLNAENRNVAIEISDTGKGISLEIQNKLFAPGVTTKENKLGIGLWWSRTFMQATGGDVVLKESVPGKETTFIIQIPCMGINENMQTPEKDVLIVDDDSFWREQLFDIVSVMGYSIEVADSYSSAINLLKKYRFTLALVDISLVGPDSENKDGLRLLGYLDSSNLETKVTIITGYGTEKDEEIARKSMKLMSFIHKKNFNLEQFQSLIRDVIESPKSSFKNPK